VQYHPDKVTSGSAEEKVHVEAVYVHLKLARDTLIEPAKRFAYDRFGLDVLGWRQCKSVRDFVMTGVPRTAVYYFASGGVLVLLGLLGYLQQGKFWRYLVMASLFVVEVQTMMRPDFPSVLSSLINPMLVRTGLRPPYLPFQMLSLLRKLSITFFIALSQLGPVFQGPQNAAGDGDVVSLQQLDRAEVLARTTDHEIARLRNMELMPFLSDQASVTRLRTSLKEWLVSNTIRNDPEVKAAIQRVLDRRRSEGRMDASMIG
jgi:hypothetical protein